jgi:dipeptidase E
MGESRETRIKEYHIYNNTSVLGLREGSWLDVNDSEVILRGSHSARWFEKDKTPREIETNTKL